ncbi:hypothetical protein EWM64_g255 [Hericium alpestre]|uniref:Uncharacterized protein n=1 Tax=Hericium alpestre TaxID=135208 RepID=A0A4Z0ACD1_9AGAM|nr:hypothetical protein EWM64_g255 [Hericium alpestre]
MSEDTGPVKRFKHQSYQRTLKDVHLPSALTQSKFDREIEDDQSHFHEALENWRQLNLSLAFVRFAGQADSLSASMPLLLLHWKDIIALWLSCVDGADDEALKALFDLMQKLAHDLRSTIIPSYSDILASLLRFLPRSISAPSLTVLLATFSALFKYLLVSSTDISLLEKTWVAVRKQLPTCNPEVQRAMAEAWGSLLRRSKTSTREGATRLMLQNLDGVEDACAWALVYACKAFICIRRVLTALIHHCKGVEQFSPAADVLVDLFKVETQFTSSDDEQLRLSRLLEVMSVVCYVRQGNRLSAKQLSFLASQTATLPITPVTQDSLLSFSTSVLVAGDVSLWMGPGRKLVEHAWEDESFGMRLCGALSDLSFDGWKALQLPYVLKLSPQLLETRPKKTLELLASLNGKRRLADVDESWRQKVDTWVTQRMSEWTRSEDKVGELHLVLQLSSMLPSISPTLIQLVEQTIDTQDPQGDYQASSANAGWVLASCLRELSKQKPSAWEKLTDLPTWIDKVLERWHWHEDVMFSLVELVQASSTTTSSLASDAVYDRLTAALLSHSQRLRLSALRLLNSQFVRTTTGAQQLIQKTLQAEEVSLDVQGVRERVLRISRLEQVISDEDAIGPDLAIRWIVSQLKVNLRPLWSPAAQALASLSPRFGDLVWKIMFDELQAIQTTEGETIPSWLSDCESSGTRDGIWEDERSWRDPVAHKTLCILARWIRDNRSIKELTESQRSSIRLDRATYETQLLTTLGLSPSLAEKHNRHLIAHFFDIAGPRGPVKLPKPKLSAWLTLFSKFINPKVLHMTDSLRSLYITLLSHPDRSLQVLSLSCIFTYKSPHLTSHEGSLRTLLDETRWRDELTNLDIATIGAEDRAELVDVVTRLLFGMMLERKGRSRGADRRAAVLSALGGCTDSELSLLVELMLEPVLPGLDRFDGPDFGVCSVPPEVTEKQQAGFLNLLGDVLKNLGSRLTSHWSALLGSTISLVAHAQVRIDAAGQSKEDTEAQEAEDTPLEEEENLEEHTGSLKALRAIRQIGFKRFADFFRNSGSFDFQPYMPKVFRCCISPRLESLARENTQAPSALLDLFYVWASRPEYALFLVDFDSRVLPQIYACLLAPGVKPSVISRILDLVDRLLELSSSDERISEQIVKPHVSGLLSNLAVLVEHTKQIAAVSNPLTQRQISILSEISHYITDGSQASTLLSLFSPLLRKTTKLVGEKVKADVLKIVYSLLPLIPELSDRSSSIYVKTFDMLSALFLNVRSRQARIALVSTFKQLASIDISLQTLADLIDALNAYSTKHMDEPDFDRRIEAFITVNETAYATFSATEWLPIIYNMLHFIQDPNELAVRRYSSQALKHFADAVAANPDSEYQRVFLRNLYPAMKNGLRSRNEMVRAEILGVLAYAVSHCNHLKILEDMRVLLAGGDEEANFFNNIYHIQVHRRTRAMRRLADYCDEGSLISATLSEVFVPLIGNFISGAPDLDHHLVNEAIRTMGHISRQLTWSSYYALIQRYLKSSRGKDGSERVYVRTLVAILDNFHFPMGEVITVEDEQGQDEEADEDNLESPEAAAEQVRADKAIAATARIADVVNSRLLPALLHHLEHRDEAEDSLRIPISVGIITVATHLPPSTREAQIGRLLTVLSQVFRSKSQETRDLARETLCKIAVILGPDYLPLILKELRAALLRGPHLHVLAYVTHALLVHVTGSENVGKFKNLDDCVSDVAHISAEAIFGDSGKDTQNEGFKTKMREVRLASSKAFDSFALIARYITPPKISGLLLPIRGIMQETEALKVMQQVDDLLRRIAGGLNSNEYLIPSELLVLCHTLVSQNSRFLQQVQKPTRRKARGDAIVQLKRDLATATDHYATNSFRFIVFGLDLFNTAFRRSRFDFEDPTTIARLEPMVSVIGNTLYSNNSHVLIQGLKASAAIVKCPLKNLEKSLPVFVRQTVDIVKQTGSIESEVVQTAFRSLAVVVRDKSNAQIKEKDLVYLIELISPDLEEPSRQAAVFSMLRAIVARKFVVPEIYDLMDKVSEIMFLLDYPQGKGRLRNQMAFLAKNLSYVHESGRKSVLELLSAVVTKFDAALIGQYADMLFVALVMLLANDDSAKCREMAAEIVKGLFSRLDTEHRRVIMSHLHSWASQQGKVQLTRVACQVYGLAVDLLQQDAGSYLSTILEDLNAVLLRSAQQFDQEVQEDDMDVDLEWQAPYHVLTVLSKVLRVFPDVAGESQKISWTAVASHLLFPHAWVRTASSRLLGVLFSTIPVASPVENNSMSELGLDMIDIAGKLCLQLKSPHLDEALNLQIVKNLFYIGKCFCAVPPPVKDDGEDSGSEDGDDDASDAEAKDREDENESRRVENPLAWLFSKLSYQARGAHIARRNRPSDSDNWYHQPSAILRWFAAMSTYMEPSRLESFLVHMLNPLYRITEDDTIHDPHMEELKTTAIELQDLVQNKVGTVKFAGVYSRIRRNVVTIQRERRTERITRATTHPEVAARRKQQRGVAKKESRKRKNSTFADGKGRMKRHRDT